MSTKSYNPQVQKTLEAVFIGSMLSAFLVFPVCCLLGLLMLAQDLYHWAENGDYDSIKLYHVVDSLIAAEPPFSVSTDAQSVNDVEALDFFHHPENHGWPALVNRGAQALGVPAWWGLPLIGLLYMSSLGLMLMSCPDCSTRWDRVHQWTAMRSHP